MQPSVYYVSTIKTFARGLTGKLLTPKQLYYTTIIVAESWAGYLFKEPHPSGLTTKSIISSALRQTSASVVDFLAPLAIHGLYRVLYPVLTTREYPGNSNFYFSCPLPTVSTFENDLAQKLLNQDLHIPMSSKFVIDKSSFSFLFILT